MRTRGRGRNTHPTRGLVTWCDGGIFPKLENITLELERNRKTCHSSVVDLYYDIQTPFQS